MRIIQPTEALVYYDGVEVFAAFDPIGGHYVGMIIDTVDSIDRYAVVGVSPDRLRRFRSGMIDLRTLFLEAPGGEWFITYADGDPGDPLSLEPQDDPIGATGYLPDPGFILSDVSVDDFALQRALQRGKVVFEFSVEPPETASDHRIRMTTLGRLLTHIQMLVRHAYRKSIAELSDTVRRTIDTTDGHLMDVTIPATEGSFRVVLEASKPPDLFGSGELARALQRMDAVFQSADSPELARDLLSPHSGHLAGSYIKLMDFLVECQTGFRYSWADPMTTEIHHGGVSEAAARELADALSGVTNLGAESVTLTGEFVRVNLEAGDWGLLTDEGRRIGKVGDGGPSLDGLVTRNRYRFECLEEAEVDASGREARTLYLQNIEPV